MILQVCVLSLNPDLRVYQWFTRILNFSKRWKLENGGGCEGYLTEAVRVTSLRL